MENTLEHCEQANCRAFYVLKLNSHPLHTAGTLLRIPIGEFSQTPYSWLGWGKKYPPVFPPLLNAFSVSSSASLVHWLDTLSRCSLKESASYLWESISQLYGVSLAVWDHTVLPTTRHKRTHPTSTPTRQAGTRFTDHLRMEGWVPRPRVPRATGPLLLCDSPGQRDLNTRS